MLATQTLLHFSEAERPLGERLLKLAAETDRIEGYREAHATEIARLAEKLGQRLGLRGVDLSALKFAALAHDLGERAMKRDYLLRPGSLTWEEQLDLWRHPIIGEQVAADLKLPRLAQLLIRWHQECWNGQGYPDGLAGRAIPLGARILRVVDTYCSLLADRPHRPRMERANVEQFIADQAGIETDPYVVKEFLLLLAEERPVMPPEVPAPDFLFSEAVPLAPAEPVVAAAVPSLANEETVQRAEGTEAFDWLGLSPPKASEPAPATQDFPTANEAAAVPEVAQPELDEFHQPENLPENQPENLPENLEEVDAAVATAPVALTEEEPTPVPKVELVAVPVTFAEPPEGVTDAAETTPLPPVVEMPEEPASLPEAPLQIVALSEAPDHFWPVAQWIYEQWWAAPDQTVSIVSDQLKEHLTGQPIPCTLVAVSGGQPVGSICLLEKANADRPDLAPCLAALYVLPAQRHRGVATQLLEAAFAKAKAMGAERVYFAVPEQEDFFARRGWQVWEPAVGTQALVVLFKQ